MVSKGLRVGAFRMVSASRLLEQSTTARNREAASELFSELLAAFPSESGYPEDVVYLLDQARQVAGINCVLALEAIDKALIVATQDRLLRQIASLLRSIDPALLKKYQDERKELPGKRDQVAGGEACREHSGRNRSLVFRGADANPWHRVLAGPD
jgi:hypothetical protein